jgi:hypothetical protein
MRHDYDPDPVSANFHVLAEALEGLEKRLCQRLDSQDKKLEIIESEVKKTNGRVNSLENKESERTTERGVISKFWVTVGSLITATTAIFSIFRPWENKP